MIIFIIIIKIEEMRSLRNEGISYEKILREMNDKYPNDLKLANMAAATVKKLIERKN
jgi:tRNA(His) 5'-end guanylyltransferase